jgi:RNA polymerase sigma factor (sigma-70 family)
VWGDGVNRAFPVLQSLEFRRQARDATAQARSVEVLALDEALDALAQIDQRKSRVVKLRHFGGLNIEETAEVLGVSVDTVKRDWRMARAWLLGTLTEKQDSAGS